MEDETLYMEACDETLRSIKVAGPEPPPTPEPGVTELSPAQLPSGAPVKEGGPAPDRSTDCGGFGPGRAARARPSWPHRYGAWKRALPGRRLGSKAKNRVAGQELERA